MRVLNDTELYQAMAATDSVQPRSLASHLNEIADYLALIGATDEAVAVWRLVYSGLVVLGDVDLATANRALVAWCYFAGDGSLVAGARSGADDGSAWSEVQASALKTDRRTRKRIAMDRWHPKAQAPRLQAARRAVAAAEPPRGERFSPTELQALPFLDSFFAMTDAGADAVLDFHLLYADIAARHGMSDIATAHFRAWSEGATGLNCIPNIVFGMTTTARLAFAGTVADRASIPVAERRERVTVWLDGLRRRLQGPPEPVAAPMEVDVVVFYGTLTFEPADDDVRDTEWEALDAGETPAAPPGQYPRAVSIGTPSETGGCRVCAEVPESAPAWKEADYAVAFPLRVMPNDLAGRPEGRVGTLFPCSPTIEKEDVGLDVPPGEYDVLARFYLLDVDEVGLRNWRVALSFLSRGSLARDAIAFGILKPERAG
jgi:hypothetical protein